MAGSIGSALVGGFTNKLLGGSSSKGSKAAGEAAKMADPFASERGKYAGLLRGLYFPQTYNPYGGYLPGMAPQSASSIGMTDEDSYGQQRVSSFLKNPIGSILVRKFRNSVRTPNIGPIARAAVPPYATAPAGDTYTGETALDRIANLPGYQFALSQGQQALERSAAAKGGFRSGGLLTDLVKYGQGMASQQYDKEVARLMTLSGANVGSPGTAGNIAFSGYRADAAQDASNAAGGGWLGSQIINSITSGGGDYGSGSYAGSTYTQNPAYWGDSNPWG